MYKLRSLTGPINCNTLKSNKNSVLISLIRTALVLVIRSYTQVLYSTFVDVMVIQSTNLISQSSGLLPTPPRHVNHQNSDPFVGQSYYPLPFPLVTILEGNNLSDLIAWDISVTSKHLKLKLEWSTSSNHSNTHLIPDILPNNILQAIKLYNLYQTSWSMSAAKNKLSSKI